MRNTAQFRLPALLCALTLPLCALLVHPVLEMGMVDDFSYTKTALTLAQTGHIAYVGWSTPIVGWQLYLGALFIKLFGFSFTVVRLSTLPVAMLTAFLTQRAFVRSGLSEWNASWGTLALVLSPMTVPLTFSYMTDIGGLLAVILCFYACLRALQTTGDRARLGWIVLAALSNAVGGTVRQVVWLGVIVMVPCTCWMLRKRPYVWATGLISCFVSYGFIFAAIQWFARAPLTQPNGGKGAGPIDKSGLIHLSLQMVRSFFELPLLVLPILVLFLLAIPKAQRRVRWIAAGVSALLLAGSIALHHRWPGATWLAPYLQNYVTLHGLVDGRFLQGERPVVLTFATRLALSIILSATLVSFFGILWSRQPRLPGVTPNPGALPRRKLVFLLVPFCCAHYLLLLPRALHGQIFDRYLIPLMAVSILFLILYYQEHFQPRLPGTAVAMILLFAAYGVAGTHDVFAMYRAFLGSIHEVEAAGVPDNRIDGGFDYNGWTQIQEAGYINSFEIITPANAYVPHTPRLGPCPLQDEWLVPVVQPQYALSFSPNACGGDAGFAPVPYHAWLGQHTVNIYVVRDTLPRN